LIYGGQERFVRAVQEEIIVRSPAEVAQHLMQSVFHPFEAFEQEELWACAVSRQGSIGY